MKLIRNFLTKIIALLVLGLPALALAHEGHGNTPLHALMHTLEENGLWIVLILVTAVSSMIYRALISGTQSKKCVRNQEPDRDAW
jgi:hypothetical protein